MENEEDFMDGLFDKSPMNKGWKEFIRTNDLTDIFKENSSGSTNNTNSYFQQNADVIRNTGEEQQRSNQTLFNNTMSTNSDGSDTTVYHSQKRPQQLLTYTEQYHSSTNTNDGKLTS